MTFAAFAALAVAWAASPASAQPIDTARIAAANPNDWLTYHGSYNSWNYSGLDQINPSNVKDLSVAWIHIPGKSTRGLQSMPLVADGVLYYTGSYSRVFALNGATGELIWSYFPELDDALVARQTHSPYNRGVALGEGKVFVGTVDGRLIALDQKTGKPAWDTKLVDSAKLTVGFTGAPLYAKGTVVIGSQGGEWPGRGPIFGVDAATGKKKWEFLTVAGTEDAKKTWGNDSWRTGGGGGWMPGSFDPETNTVYWGTANPAPLYDWAGSDWMNTGARPGINLYTTSVLGLDIDSGSLKFFHQELPHDGWDYDSAPGEFVLLEKDGKKYVVHPNKSGFIFVYDDNLKVQNIYPLINNINFVKSIDPKTGELMGRRDFSAGKQAEPLCPAIDGGISWNSGSYNPMTGLYYKIGNEWCISLEVVKTTPVVEPVVQLNIGANFKLVPPPGGTIYGHLDARDPITGAKKWEVRFPEPPMASVLSTAGGLVFVPDSRGTVHAYDAKTGAELWSHSDGIGHQGGIISYSAGGKQYVAVVAGFGGMVSDDFAPTFGEPYRSMPRDDGVLVVYSLK
ncbi:MAG: PQQ-binding-like beta-propeller repeat protein [Methylobacteriaceae bacterium]|nr:PQQ-binding-like beta-propeller repeat protein [Methylobacteriaceae bacterium]MBV9702907.1 PQQ-binding-like beta-propeller repeat protein [Methylobacteriaceae bacterium]